MNIALIVIGTVLFLAGITTLGFAKKKGDGPIKNEANKKDDEASKKDELPGFSFAADYLAAFSDSDRKRKLLLIIGGSLAGVGAILLIVGFSISNEEDLECNPPCPPVTHICFDPATDTCLTIAKAYDRENCTAAGINLCSPLETCEDGRCIPAGKKACGVFFYDENTESCCPLVAGTDIKVVCPGDGIPVGGCGEDEDGCKGDDYPEDLNVNECRKAADCMRPVSTCIGEGGVQENCINSVATYGLPFCRKTGGNEGDVGDCFLPSIPPGAAGSVPCYDTCGGNSEYCWNNGSLIECRDCPGKIVRVGTGPFSYTYESNEGKGEAYPQPCPMVTGGNDCFCSCKNDQSRENLSAVPGASCTLFPT